MVEKEGGRLRGVGRIEGAGRNDTRWGDDSLTGICDAD